MSDSRILLTPGRNLLLDFGQEDVLCIENSCGPENVVNVMTFIQTYVALLLDSPTDDTKPLRVIRRFFLRLIDDTKGTITSLKNLADQLLATATTVSDSTLTGEFLEDMKRTPVYREYLHFYRTGDTRTLRYLLTFLYFGKKIGYVDADFYSTAFRGWMETEVELESLLIDSDIADALRVIISQILEPLDDDILLPKHGPGYTAEGCLDPNEKLDQLTFDNKSRYAFREGSFGREPLQVRNGLHAFDERAAKRQVAKLRFVPKDITKSRSICMEPAGRMFLQQEVFRWLNESIRRGQLSRIVNLSDQDRNRQYAQAGSYSQSCDTIDLSSASDRVSYDLVKRIFPRKILYYLVATRTNEVDMGDCGGMLPAGTHEIRELLKFAPMGSALCFPVQCIVFSAITLLSYLMYAEKQTPGQLVTNKLSRLYRVKNFIDTMYDDPEQLIPHRLLRPCVYGDDIICDSHTTDGILSLLARCGLKVNSTKSYIGGTPFRESCGIFAWLGDDVTPCLYRLHEHTTSLNASQLASYIDQMNRLGDHGLLHARNAIYHRLLGLNVSGIRDKNSYLPYTDNADNFGIFTTHVRESKHMRVNVDLQRDERRVMVLRSVYSHAPLSEFMELYAYDQWSRSRVRGGSIESNYSISRIRPQLTRVALGWNPA